MTRNFSVLVASILLLTACQSAQPGSPDAQDASQVETACTKEAKICPDGSTVGRTGPNCEFAACPGISSEAPKEVWKTKTDEKLGVSSFTYPDPLGAKYITFLTDEEFHPKFTLYSEPQICPEPTAEMGEKGVEQKALDGQDYCVKEEVTAAAGSTYSTYTYTRAYGTDQPVALTFTLRELNCSNYDEPQKTECEQEQGQFKVDDLAVRMINSLLD